MNNTTNTGLNVAPLPSVRRLPIYLNYLKKLARENVPEVSTTDMSGEIGALPVQIRKDLAVTGIRGKPKTGYKTAELIAAIETFLGWDNTRDAFLAGAGNMGRALIGHGKFRELGLNIVAAFDTDPEKIGEKINGVEVLPVGKMPGLIERMHVKIGILTLPGEHAQKTADLMMEAGILALWNFSAARISVPAGVIVEDVTLASSLSVLTSRLNEMLKKKL